MQKKMRYRICPDISVGGNSSPDLINEKGTGNTKTDATIKACAKACYENFFKGTKMDERYCAAGVHGHEVRFGIEPSYMYEELKLICIDKNKEWSRLWTGIAFGPWGSGIRSRHKRYGEYKRKSKFVKFVDEWHKKIYEQEI